jgi:GTPase SAR1 family protein
MKFLNFLLEQKEKHAVMAFGRMNPITSGHQKLVNRVKEIAKQVGGSHHIILSHTQDTKKNPLSAEQKVKHARRAFPGTNFSHSTPTSPNFLTQAADLHKKGVTHLHAVGGSDRVDEFKKTLERYNGTHEGALFNFKKITVHSAGERDPEAEGATGMSASKMRDHASKGDFEEFKKGAPSTMSHEHVRHMYNDVRRGMKIDENVNEEFVEFLSEGVHDKSIFKAMFLAGGPGSGKDYVLDNTLSGHGLTEINSDKALEFLMDKEGLDKKMPESEQEKRDLVRGRAKNVTELRQRLALFGRNGLIINGTGDDPEKIKKIKDRLEELGYETSMLMVNTDDDVSQARNIERGQRGGRTVPEKIRKQKWDAVQAARPELAKLFGDRYTEFDNSEDLRTAAPDIVKAKKNEMLGLFKNVQSFVSEPPNLQKAQEWIATELQKKDVLPIEKNGVEKTPHPNSMAADEARKMGLQYYGFGRYGKNGTVTHRSINDKLIKVDKKQQEIPNLPVPGSSMRKSVNENFEEYFSEDLRKWFDPKHPKGGWKRINTKGEVVGPCAREPGEPKPKCMSNEKIASLSKTERASAVRAKRKHDPDPERKGAPINVSNYGKGKLSEHYDLSDSSALNLLLLGTKIEETNFDDLSEDKKVNLLKSSDGKVRIFMLRRAAAKEAHQKNGTVLPYKNGYVIKLNEENEDVELSKKIVYEENGRLGGEAGSTVRRTEAKGNTDGSNSLITEGAGSEYSRSQRKITISEIYKKQKEKVKESIDKGIEPGLSMAGAGESISRGMGDRIRKRTGKAGPVVELTGDETTLSIGDQKENELKKVGINLQTFKAKRPIG